MARSRSIGNVYAELSIKDKMTVGLKRAQKSLSAFSRQAVAVGTVTAGAMAAGMAAGTKRALSMVDATSDLAAATGLSVSEMMKQQRAYEDGGRSASMAAKDIARMQKSIVEASGGGSDPFAEIGLSAKELLQMSPGAQFEKIGSAIMKMTNPAERNAKAMQIFGKSGSGLATIFGNMDASIRSLGRMPEVAEQFAGAMGEANDILGRMPAKSDAFFVGFTSGIIGQLLPELRKLDEHDFTTLGENLGNTLSTAFEALRGEEFWQVISLKGSAAMMEVAAALGDGIQTIWDKTKNSAMVTGLTGMRIKAFGTEKDYNRFLEGLAYRGQYQQSGGSDTANFLRQQADQIWNEMERQAKNRRDKARESGKGSAPPIPVEVVPVAGMRLEETGIPGLASMLDAITASLAPTADRAADAPESREAADFQTSAFEVNEMQRRGLGFGGETLAKEATRQVSLLTEIRDVLKRASTDGSLNWT